LQVFLKPDHSFQIEMICWLVQKEQIRLINEQTGQVSSHNPTTAEFLRRPVKVAKSEAGQNLLGFSFSLEIYFTGIGDRRRFSSI
jgi:hypothetical protein